MPWQWNNWAAGERMLIARTYILATLDLHRYLISEGVSAEPARSARSVHFDVDASRYAPELHADVHYPQPESGNAEAKIKPRRREGPAHGQDRQPALVRPAQRRGGRGIYTVSLTRAGRRPRGGPRRDARLRLQRRCHRRGRPQARLDRPASSPSYRPATASAARSSLRVPGGDYETFKERQPDASESSLLYLFFILILVVEQAMAVHLSYHSPRRASRARRGRCPRRRRRRRRDLPFSASRERAALHRLGLRWLNDASMNTTSITDRDKR